MLLFQLYQVLSSFFYSYLSFENCKSIKRSSIENLKLSHTCHMFVVLEHWVVPFAALFIVGSRKHSPELYLLHKVMLSWSFVLSTHSYWVGYWWSVLSPACFLAKRSLQSHPSVLHNTGNMTTTYCQDDRQKVCAVCTSYYYLFIKDSIYFYNQYHKK